MIFVGIDEEFMRGSCLSGQSVPCLSLSIEEQQQQEEAAMPGLLKKKKKKKECDRDNGPSWSWS